MLCNVSKIKFVLFVDDTKFLFLREFTRYLEDYYFRNV